MVASQFQQAQDRLQQSILTMASLADRNLSSAMDGLMNRDFDLLEKAIAGDEEVDQLEKDVQSAGLEILVRFQPEGYDMRRVTATMQVSTDLERVSDQAVTIARRSRRIVEAPPGRVIVLVEPIYEKAEQILTEAIRAFIDGDVPRALTLKGKDNDLDEHHRRVIDRVLQEMQEVPHLIPSLFSFATIIRALERVGDHGVNISEHTVFIERGTDIRHGAREDLE